MSPQSRLVAGIVLIIVPTVGIGGASLLSLLIADPSYGQNDLRQDLWRAGHAHAGVWLVLSLVALRYRVRNKAGWTSITLQATERTTNRGRRTKCW